MPVSNDLGSMGGLDSVLARAGLAAQARVAAKAKETTAADVADAPTYNKNLSEFGGMKLVSLDRSIGMSDAAIDGVSQSMKVLEQMRGLAQQATRGVMSSQARQNLVSQLAKASAELDEIAKDTVYDGTKLADGSAKEIAVGFDTYIHAATLFDTSSGGLGVNALDLGSSAGATKAMQGIDAAMSKLGDQRVDLARYKDAMVQNLRNARSSAADAGVRDAGQAKDLAAEVRDRMGGLVAETKTQASIAALSTSNQAAQSVLSLLR